MARQSRDAGRDERAKTTGSTLRLPADSIRAQREDSMDPVAAIALWAALFLATHLIISSSAVRPRLLAAIGAQLYQGLYSIVALGTFIPLAIVFARHKHAGAMLWNLRDVPPVRWLVWVLMLIAFTIFIAGLINPSPASMAAPSNTAAPRGILKLTRHPGFVGFSLFGLAHMLMNGFVGDILFFATFPALSIIGGIHQDQRKLAELGDSYRSLMSQTSFIPGAALLSGRQRFTTADIPLAAIAAGVATTIVVIILHPYIFGGSPLG
jgi:uncharacterized membrane protein